ncbi:MAG TPA: hydrolase 1, exosortase A system-associated, partial [Rugosibacter sp.]|nr:hydrolase 1, exosortase A system-associated [Rugosibacter sp.]
CAAQFVLPENTRQVWCVEVDTWADSTETDKVSAKPAALSATLLRTVTAWQAQGVCVEANAVAGAAFWQVAEAPDCTAMLEMTQRLLTGGDGVKNVAEMLLDSINEEADFPARVVPGEKLPRHGMALDSEGTRVFEASLNEAAVSFGDQGQPMLGVVNLPAKPNETGVLILVGGRQYRVGSHRQFVHLARRLASADFSTFRFDFRGMGDSAGEPQSFEAMDADIATALAAFKAHCPQIKRVVLWGLCDGATAAALYWQRTQDPFVAGLCLVNPWLRTEASLARARVKHYYVERLFDGGFWRKLLTGGVGFFASIKEYFTQWRASRRITSADFITQTLDGLRRFPGALLVVLSGRDLVAKEFMDTLTSAEGLVLFNAPHHKCQSIPDADHTFSRSASRSELEVIVEAWVKTTIPS